MNARRSEFIPTSLFLGARKEHEGAKVMLFGCPYDGTASYRPGARFGPAAIREASQVLETYDSRTKIDLDNCAFCDLGDLEISHGDKAGTLLQIETVARDLLTEGKIPAALGGEHLISLPLVKAAHAFFPDMVLVQFDAHLDLRDKYLDDPLSHATVIRRIADLLHPSRILQVGTRSGTLEEYEFCRECRNLEANADDIPRWISDRPVYVTVDLDVLDPSVFPGTGTPEPGGVSYGILEDWLLSLKGQNIIGWDVVELAPHWDPTQVSSIVAAKVVRTLVSLTAVC